MTVCRGPFPEEPLSLADPVSGLLKATKANEEHGFRTQRVDRSPREANTLRQVTSVERTPQRGLPFAGQHVRRREQSALEGLDCRDTDLVGHAKPLREDGASTGEVAPERWTASVGATSPPP